MQMRHSILLFTFFIITITDSFGQEQPAKPILIDSIVKKFKIRQVTENWFTSLGMTKPSNTTYDIYDELGNRLQRVHINYFYHKFISTYFLNLKKGILIEKQEYFDWNPYREKNKGDTIIKRTVRKYSNAEKKKNKKSGIDKFLRKLTFDNEGKVIEQTDSIKFGYAITSFTYDMEKRLIERKIFISRFSEKRQLESIDSLFYIPNTNLISNEISYYGIRNNEDQIIKDRFIERRNRYNESGLLIEREISENYLSLNKPSQPTIYKYEYSYFD